MRKPIFASLGIVTISLCGCSDETVEESHNIPPDSRAVRAITVVWQAQPGEFDVPLGQAVTINTDGSVVK